MYDTEDNEKGNLLANKGIELFAECGRIPLDFLGEKVVGYLKDDWNEFSRRSRKEAVVSFRLRTGLTVYPNTSPE
ncbi:hypothetical protein TNCV_3237051 [Trichonephila clavipes]|nr:hypothetical protein TNCV_3237051 [Trichonephila clavipes]